MVDQTMATYTITPSFNFDSGKLEFINQKGRPVGFTYLPQSLDMRGGIEKRDYSYLQPALLAPKDPGYVEIINPFIVFPKGFLGSAHESLNGWAGDALYADNYTLIQGNTRYKLVEAVKNHLESVWQTINAENISQDEKIARFNAGIDRSIELIQANAAITEKGSVDLQRQSDEKFIQELYENVRGVKPFPINVISEEKANDWEFVIWLQRAINDGVKAQGVLQNARMAIEYLSFLTGQNEKLPKEQQKKRKELVSNAMMAFGLQSSRFYHYQMVFNSPEWLQTAIADNTLSIDTAIDFLNTYGRIVKAYETKGKTLVMKIEHFYEVVKDLANLDRKPEGALKIFTSHVLKAEESAMDAITPEPEAPAPSVVEGSDTTGEGSNDSDEATGKDKDPKMDTEAYLAAIKELLTSSLEDKLFALMEGATSVIVTGEDGTESSRYVDASLKKVYKALSQLSEVLALSSDGSFSQLVTLEQQKAEAELKKAAKEAEKANQSVTVSPDQVDAANSALQELAPV